MEVSLNVVSTVAFPILTSYRRLIILALACGEVVCSVWSLVQSALFCFVFQSFFCVALVKRSSIGVKLEETNRSPMFRIYESHS